jgi:hypothetical protein
MGAIENSVKFSIQGGAIDVGFDVTRLWVPECSEEGFDFPACLEDGRKASSCKI